MESPEPTRLTISTPAAEAEICLQGAHLTKWIPRGHKPVLFTSAHSLFAAGKPIRGGVPIIFPWFGSRSDGKPGPAHGYARTSLWNLDRKSADLALSLRADGALLRFEASIGSTLTMKLTVENHSPTTLVFEEALHTYFAVGDARQISVAGLENTGYIDKTDEFKRKAQAGQPIRLTGETDRVYLDTEATCVVDDPVWKRHILVEKTNSRTTVLWNPWIEKAAAMPDFGADEWKEMVCVETANAGENRVSLASGEAHTMCVTISVVSAE